MTPELEVKLKARGLNTAEKLFDAEVTPQNREDWRRRPLRSSE
jgi:hypothetical protein